MAYRKLTKRGLDMGMELCCPLCGEGPLYIGLDSERLSKGGSMWTHWRDTHRAITFENTLMEKELNESVCIVCGENLYTIAQGDARLLCTLDRKRWVCLFMYHMCALSKQDAQSHMMLLLLTANQEGLKL